MKTINKFRVWTGYEMCYDVVVGKFGAFYVNPSNNGLDENDSASLTRLNTKYPESVPVMLAMNHTDKNGKMIWEGDVVRNDRGEWNVVVRKGPFFEATVSEDQSSLYSLDWWSRTEVIGNIYENPELLQNKS